MEYYKKNVIDAMYGIFEPMLKLNDELTKMKEEYHSTALEKKTLWQGAFFDALQYDEIQRGLDAGINVASYANPEYSAISMSLMRIALEAGVDISPIVDNNKHFSERQLALLVVAAMAGESMDLIAYPELELERMRARLLDEYFPIDMPDPGITIDDMHEYGYMEDYVMLPLLSEKAEELYTSYDIYMLYRDGGEVLVEHEDMIRQHAENGGVFGIEKQNWKRELAQKTAEQFSTLPAAGYDEFMNEADKYNKIIPEFVQKTRACYKPISGMDMYDVENAVQDYFSAKADEYGLQITIIDIAICGSRSRGLEHGLSDLDVVIEYEMTGDTELNETMKEDAVFNIMHEDDFKIEGVVIDINPITATQSGTIQDYLVHADAYLAKKAKQREQERNRFSNEVDSVLEGTYGRYDALKVCDTPDILSAVGCRKLPMLYTQKHLKNAIGMKVNSKDHIHNLTIEQIKKLPEMLRDPIMVMDSISRDDSLVVVTEQLDNVQHPIIVIVRPHGVGVYEVNPLDTNFITSVYAKDNIYNFISNEINEGKVLYWNKNKSQALFSVLQLQLPQGLNNLDSNIILHKSSNIVNENQRKNEEKREEKISNHRR